MKFASHLLLVLSLLSTLALRAATSDDMQIYSDRLNKTSESNRNYESD